MLDILEHESMPRSNLLVGQREKNIKLHKLYISSKRMKNKVERPDI